MSIFEQVAAIIKAEFPKFKGDIERDTQATDVDGWDSLAHTLVILRIENEMGIEIDPDAALDFEDIGALADYVEGRL